MPSHSDAGERRERTKGDAVATRRQVSPVKKRSRSRSAHREEKLQRHHHHRRQQNHDNLDLREPQNNPDNDAQSHRSKRHERVGRDHDDHAIVRIEARIKSEPRDDHSDIRVKQELQDEPEQKHGRHGSTRPDVKRRYRPDEDEEEIRAQRRERYGNDRQRLQQHRDRRIKQEDGGEEDHPWGSGTGGANSKKGAAAKNGEPKDKEKPSLELSGKLAEDTNTFRGVVIKYVEPSEARKPKKRWRFHPFKGEEPLPVLHLHRQSAFLFGRDRRIADIPVDHPSCSKQHAVLQFRLVPYTRPDGSNGRRVCPYVIDLGSANGTYVNNQRIEAQRYVELLEKDVIKFGFSSRDYVLLHDSSDTSEVVVGDDEGEGDN